MVVYQTNKDHSEGDKIAQAIWHNLQSPNECDSNGEVANLVDGLFAIARSIRLFGGCYPNQSTPQGRLGRFPGHPHIQPRRPT